MIIKKFQAETEAKAVLKAKEEMGSGAVVLNIKTIKPRGISRLFKQNIVEVTAALEEAAIPSVPKSINVAVGADTGRNTAAPSRMYPMEPAANTSSNTAAIEEKLNNLQSMLESRMRSEVRDAMEDKEEIPELEETEKETDVNIKFIRLIYNQLIDNEVEEKYVNQIIGEIQSTLRKEATLDSILAAVYQKIILKIGEPKVIDLEGSKSKLVFLLGPTGVGKTTTIAKLASYFKLEKKKEVALITSDTYRIAAVEQLRTYAGILNVPMEVIYTMEEFSQAVEEFKGYDLVLVDTAGRSHKDVEKCDEVTHLVNDSKAAEGMEKEVYLVLSAATKYRNLIKINEAFKHIKNYNIIFTKLDETSCLGNILNMKLNTGVNLSYITSGQVVPDDISVLNPQKITRSLLGSNE